MAYLIGTDEAGYGPNLGPLVITGTLWKVPSVETDLYSALSDCISANRTANKIRACDSKQLYQSSGGIAALEKYATAFLRETPTDWIELSKLLSCQRPAKESEPWLINANLSLPLAAEQPEIATLRSRLVKTCEAAQVKLLGTVSATLFPSEFNQAIHQNGNKATVLTKTTLNIISGLLDRCEDGPVKIICDKHGGRSKYAGVLQQYLTDELVSIHEEGRQSSRYSWSEQGTEIGIEFNAGGESHLPTAVASMFSKYVREVYMKIWNEFWAGHLPGLKPTKGYPQDAKRFWSEIATTCETLKIPRELLWRER